jgi:surface antigen
LNKDKKLELAVYFKFLIVFAFLLTTLIPFTYMENEVNAQSITSMDGQNGCVTSSSSDDDDDKKDDGDKKDKGDDDDSDSGDISGKQKKNLKTMYEVLHEEYGVSGKMVAGIAGNWDAEGGIDPMATEGDSGNFSVANAKKATDDDSRGIGLGQWTFERHTQLVDYAKDEDTDWWKMDIQMKFMVSGDSSADTLKSIVKDSGDDVAKNATEFHDKWEISADDSAMKQRRADSAKDFWKYMKSNGMDGKKDTKKIDKIGTKSKSNKTEGESSASTTDDKKETNDCGSEEDSNDGGKEGKTSGKMGDSVKANGKKGKVIGKNYSYDELPDKYKDKIQLPDFDKKYLDKPGNVFPPTNNKGECTELTWAYMSQLYSGKQPSNGDGYIIYKAYKEKGAKTTHNPTVGYGFSSSAPYAGASATPPGHTGVVVGVMDDGKWIMANYNVPPALAPSRKVLYSVVDGVPKDAGNDLIFFEGIGKPKIDNKDKKDDKKKDD